MSEAADSHNQSSAAPLPRWQQAIADRQEYAAVVVQKPWGYEYMLFCNEEVCIWVLFIQEGHRTSMHCHPNKQTALVVLEGRAQFETLSAQLTVSAGQVVAIGKKVFHCTRALSSGGVLVMETETPVDKKDLLRLSDGYGREGQGYEGKESTLSRDPRVHYSFHDESQGYAGVEKRFGQCLLLIQRFQGDEQFQAGIARQQADLLCVLKGGVCTPEGTAVLSVGQTSSLLEVRKHPSVRLSSSETELLFITRVVE